MSEAMKDMYKEAWGKLWFVFYYTYEFLNYLRWRSEELSENVLDLTAERHTNKMTNDQHVEEEVRLLKIKKC